jgi:hypothetical protein
VSAPLISPFEPHEAFFFLAEARIRKRKGSQVEFRLTRSFFQSFKFPSAGARRSHERCNYETPYLLSHLRID